MSIPSCALRGLPNSRNWGDRIAGWIFERLNGTSAQWMEVLDPQAQTKAHYLTVGSILRFANSASVVWGSGFISADDTVGATQWKGSISHPVSPQITAVRGPRSRDRLRALGLECPEVYGDPVLLMPRLYAPERQVQHALGVICHYADADDPRLHRLRADDRVHFINIMQFDLLKTVREVLSCERIVATSLHGLVLADAYGIPARWMKMVYQPGAPYAWEREHWATFKFQDHLAAVGRETLAVLEAHSDVHPDDLLQAALEADAVPASFDDQPLLDACPFQHRGEDRARASA